MTEPLACIIAFALLLFCMGWSEMQDKQSRPKAPSRFELLDPDNHTVVIVGNIQYRVNNKETSDGPA